MSPDRHAEHRHDGSGRDAPSPRATKDPVCGMDVAPANAAGGSAEHAGAKYWFCRELPEAVRRGPITLRNAAAGASDRHRCRRPDLHVSDAPADSTEGARLVSHLRHGAGGREPQHLVGRAIADGLHRHELRLALGEGVLGRVGDLDGIERTAAS